MVRACGLFSGEENGLEAGVGAAVGLTRCLDHHGKGSVHRGKWKYREASMTQRGP